MNVLLVGTSLAHANHGFNILSRKETAQILLPEIRSARALGGRGVSSGRDRCSTIPSHLSSLHSNPLCHQGRLPSSPARQAGAALGAIVGAIAGGGKGAAIGAGAGALPTLTKGGAIRVPVESVFTFQVDKPLKVTAMQ
jgi:hypothetical protein